MATSTTPKDADCRDRRAKESSWQKIVFAVLLPILMAQGLWLFNVTWDLEKRTTAIEANRFTSRDGADTLREILTRYETLRTSVEELRRQMPEEVPPEWFRQIVNANTKAIRELEARVAECERAGKPK